MKILKNKITQVVTEFQDNEFPADFENWIEASASEITENKKQKLKKKLIASRQDFLSRTRDEAFRDMERGINTSLREKRLRQDLQDRRRRDERSHPPCALRRTS